MREIEIVRNFENECLYKGVKEHKKNVRVKYLSVLRWFFILLTTHFTKQKSPNPKTNIMTI